MSYMASNASEAHHKPKPQYGNIVINPWGYEKSEQPKRDEETLSRMEEEVKKVEKLQPKKSEICIEKSFDNDNQMIKSTELHKAEIKNIEVYK